MILTSLLKADENQFRQEMLEEAHYQQFCMQHPRLEMLFRLGRGLKYAVRIRFNRTVLCPILGHNYQSSSWFLRDEGIEIFWCKRCKIDGQHRLY